MDFFRHSYSPFFHIENNDLIANFLTDLSNFGFVSTETNEPIYKTFYKQNLTDMHWKNDLLHQARIRRVMTDETSQVFGELQFCLSSDSAIGNNNFDVWTYRNNRGGSYYEGQKCSYIVRHAKNNSVDLRYTIRNSVIIIPLLNGGFLYNLMSAQQTTTIQPTPKLIIRGDVTDYRVDVPNVAYSNNLTIIGIPPTIKSSINNYIYFGIYGYYNGSETNVGRRYLTDYQHGRVLDYIPYTTTNVPLVENTCVLTKMPHDNGYLDNVYTMTTRPGPLTVRGSIFSFAGRNFINVIDNLVLELPS